MKVGDLVTTKAVCSPGMSPGWIPMGAVGVVIKKDGGQTTIKWLSGNTMPNGKRMSETTRSDDELRLEIISESK